MSTKTCRAGTVFALNKRSFFTGIMGLNQDALNRVNKLIWIGKTLFHWGFIPSILLLGFAKGAEPGMPELTLASLLWA